MKKEIADEWVKALRSGEYKQGKNALLKEDAYCCLGVLCKIAEKHSVIEMPIPNPAPNVIAAYLPKSVQHWAEMASDNGFISEKYGLTESLATMNDGGMSFDNIANFIEKNYEAL